jgi:hypothetical protein
VQAQEAVDQLVQRVRAAATDDGFDALRAALRAELQQAGRRQARREYAPWRDGIDVPGAAYESLVRAVIRRAGGQFQTPFWAADLMTGWLLQERTRLLLDPGVGAGRLLFRAWLRSEPGPEQMLGIDVDPLCVDMARLNLRLRGAEGFRLREANFLLDGLRVTPDAIVANPPFSRHHSITAEEKEEIHAGIKRRLGLRLSRLAGLHALFLVRALEVAADGARLAFIAPVDWLDTESGAAIKRFVLDTASVEAVIVFNSRDAVFAGVRTRPAVLFLRKGTASNEATVIRLPAKRPEHPDAVLAALRGEESELRTREVTLSADQRWSDPRRPARDGRPLSELARVRRGIATGRNRFFVLSEADRRRHGLDGRDLRRCLATPQLIEGTEVGAGDLADLPDDARRWILNSRDPDAEHADDALGAYLRQGRELGAADTYLATHRHPCWFAPEVRDDCPILFPYMNSTRARFIRNRSDAIPLNNFLIIEPNEGVDPDRLWRTLNKPGVIRQLKRLGRDYGDGMWKLEPRELSRIRVTM